MEHDNDPRKGGHHQNDRRQNRYQRQRQQDPQLSRYGAVIVADRDRRRIGNIQFRQFFRCFRFSRVLQGSAARRIAGLANAVA